MSKSTFHALGHVLNESPYVFHSQLWSTHSLIYSKSVEILPGNGDEWFSPDIKANERFLLLEGNLGIPQKILLQAYSESVAVFQRCRALLRSHMQPPTGHPNLTTELLYTSAILVVLNPAHQTAWNTRKLLVAAGSRDAFVELALTTALLHVRDCAKQSLLWHHRRWLLRRLYSEPAAEPAVRAQTLPRVRVWDAMQDEDSLPYTVIPLAALRDEFAACTLACDIYERNYFAWSHRLRCLDALVAKFSPSAHPQDPPQSAETDRLLREEHGQSLEWVEQHVSDYTAMHYRCRVDRALQQLAQAPRELHWYQTLNFTGLAHAKSLLEAYPDHEALWLYMRASASLAESSTPNSDVSDLEAFAQRFFPKGQQPVPTMTMDQTAPTTGPAEAERHALRLLAWIERFHPGHSAVGSIEDP